MTNIERLLQMYKDQRAGREKTVAMHNLCMDMDYAELVEALPKAEALSLEIAEDKLRRCKELNAPYNIIQTAELLYEHALSKKSMLTTMIRGAMQRKKIPFN